MTLIIAECGVNHNGSEAEAFSLIYAAAEAGANVAKFQLFRPEGARAQYAHLCLPLYAYPRLDAFCRARGIGFACTAFDAESLRWLLANTRMDFVKISSGEALNAELLQVADESGLRIIQSLRRGAETFSTKRPRDILHVVSEYPTQPEHADIMMVTRRSGLSDHSGDIFMPLAAVALGAKIIECHITLDKNQDGPDHKASLDPAQFREMVRGIRAIGKALV